MLDFRVTSHEAGKPTSVDLHLGLATAPVLFAAKEVCVCVFILYISCVCLQYPELYVLMKRRFMGEGDIQTAVAAIQNVNTSNVRTSQFVYFLLLYLITEQCTC